MRVLGQDSRLSTALLELFLSSPGSPSSFRLRSRVYACAATGLPRGPRASLLRAQRYHNICTRGEPGIRACITCERVTVTREPPESTLLSLLRNFSFVLAHPSRAVSIFSFFSVSLSLPSSLFRSLSTRVKLVNPLSISKRQIVSQSFLLDFNEIIRTRGSSNVRPSFSTPPRRRFGLLESALFRVGRLLKHRRQEFYARRVIQPRARTHVRTFFLVVCHREARDLSLSAFLIAPRSAPGRLTCNRDSPVANDFAFFAPFRGFDFRCCKILDPPSRWTSALCRFFSLSLSLSLSLIVRRYEMNDVEKLLRI